MKQIYTSARKANRISGFRKHGHFDAPSRMRQLKRDHLQPKKDKTFGRQVIRTQRVFLKKDLFGYPIYRTIKHAASEV